MCFGGSKPSTTSSSSVQLPDWMSNNLQTISNNSMNLSNTPFQAYNGQMTAGTNAAQAGAAQGYAGIAGQSAPQIGGQDIASQIGTFMSPYIGSVVDATTAQMQKANQQNLQGIKGQAALTGSFGGDREAIAEQEAQSDYTKNLASTVSGLYNQGFTTALDGAQNQAGLDQSASIANQNAALTGTQQNLAGLTGVMGFGNQQQTTDQASLDSQYNEFMRSVNDPFQKQQFASGIITGQAPQFATQNSTSTGPKPNTFNQVAGGIGAAAGIAGLFSDRRAKTDIKKLGKDPESGEQMYAYRYKGDPKSYPKVVGPMAQDLEKSDPNSVSEIGGHKVITGRGRSKKIHRALRNIWGASRGYAVGGMPDDEDDDDPSMAVPPAARPAPAGPARPSVAIGVPEHLLPHYKAASERYGVPLPWLLAQSRVESNFREGVRGKSGEHGLMQIMPATAADPGYGVRPRSIEEISTPEGNIDMGAEYLSKKTRGTNWNDPASAATALRRYNGGGDPNYAEKIFASLGMSAPPPGERRRSPASPLMRAKSSYSLSADPAVIALESGANRPRNGVEDLRYSSSAVDPDEEEGEKPTSEIGKYLAKIGNRMNSSEGRLPMFLLTTGLGMMASRSPYAGVGIGEGGLKGIEYLQNARSQDISQGDKSLNRRIQGIAAEAAMIRAKAAERMAGGPGADARRPMTAQELIAAGQDPKTTIGTYDRYGVPKFQSRPLSIEERQGIARAGTPPVENAGDKEYSTKLGQNAVEIGQGMQAGQEELTGYDNMERALAGAGQTGPLSKAQQKIGAWAQQLGIPDSVLEKFGMDKDRVASLEEVRNLSGMRILDALRNKVFPSQGFSNEDRRFLEEIQPGLANTPAGNKLILELGRAAARRRIEMSQSWLSFRKENQSMPVSTAFERFQYEVMPKIAEKDREYLRRSADPKLLEQAKKEAQLATVAGPAQPSGDRASIGNNRRDSAGSPPAAPGGSPSGPPAAQPAASPPGAPAAPVAAPPSSAALAKLAISALVGAGIQNPTPDQVKAYIQQHFGRQ